MQCHNFSEYATSVLVPNMSDVLVQILLAI